ncbi:putative DUF21 domain-containing protein At3g13070, chloroplastic isoform X3 [Rosa rugosa]|uniref:putative DUF21 domain-containing protein At3g13070, chloroplastic isoform X3 n=1 Tax=Rosa rugosa TaxID=74645 RepID=UPI002B4165BC|nr:putative DUF21 domain-containing protein At3g13070, chloroplastic isoform X3 [Rosa rugosa]
MALESSILSPPRFISGSKSLSFLYYHKQKNFPNKVLVQNNRYPFRLVSNCIGNSDFRRFLGPRCEGVDLFANRARLRAVGKDSESSSGTNAVSGLGFDFVRVMVKCGVVLAAMVCGVLVYGSRRAFAVEGVVNASYGIVDRCILMFRNAWPKTLLVLQVFKEQGLILAALLGLSAFFSMAETSITTLWPWKVRELAEKEPENGVFRLLRNDVTRFLTTILIGTTVVNIGATALVTEAATAIFGEAGVSAATGVMTDMIENVLEIKDTHVREVMTPLVDVVAIDASATLIDFHDLWVTHQYSRVPVFEQRVDNIVGIAYAMDLLDYVQKGELLESTTVGDMAQKPGYFVPDSMSVWNLLREFRIRKVHMAVVLNEYGGTVGIITLEDVVEEIVGEIFDENDSKEEIQKKTGYIVMRAEGVFDVDANTSIDQLSEDLNVKMPEGHQYETVSGFICEAFGYIPRTGESIKVVLEKENEEENDESKSEKQEKKEKHQIFKLEILAGNARKVGAVRFERLENDTATLETKEVARLVPKIVKRKSSSGHDSDGGEYDEDSFQKRPHLEISDEHEDTVDNLSRH